MNETVFWDIINSSKEINQNDIVKQRICIENTLSKYSINEIREFNYISEILIKKAENNGLHDFLCNEFKDEYISTSVFDFFMGWLLLQGSALYYQTIKDPNFLIEVIEINFNNDFSVLKHEEAIHMGLNAYETKTGRNYYEDSQNGLF